MAYMMKISQIGPKQYIYNPPIFINRHAKKNSVKSIGDIYKKSPQQVINEAKVISHAQRSFENNSSLNKLNVI